MNRLPEDEAKQAKSAKDQETEDVTSESDVDNSNILFTLKLEEDLWPDDEAADGPHNAGNPEITKS